MKEYFGEDNTFEYIKFYDENNGLTNEDIIPKYLDKLTNSRI